MGRTDMAKGNIWPETDSQYLKIKNGNGCHWSELDIEQYIRAGGNPNRDPGYKSFAREKGR